MKSCPADFIQRRMRDSKISELTTTQLRQLIRETVQEAVAEVLIEMHAIAEAESELQAEAEMAAYLKAAMQGIPYQETLFTPRLDD